MRTKHLSAFEIEQFISHWSTLSIQKLYDIRDGQEAAIGLMKDRTGVCKLREKQNLLCNAIFIRIREEKAVA